MRHVSSEKYNLAWYKLAEFVARREKERALAMLRLLTHGFQDDALKYQLEGDLLHSFDDPAATDRYAQAAQLYKKSGKSIDAIALLELLKLLHPDSSVYAVELVAQYVQMHDSKKALDNFLLALPLLLASNQLVKLHTLFHEDVDRLDDAHKIYAYHATVLAMIKSAIEDRVIKDYLSRTINLLQDNKLKLHALLEDIKLLNDSWHAFAEEQALLL